MKVQLGPTDVFFPVPAALIVSGTTERPNIATVAWIGIMGSSPPVIAISLKNGRYSLELIRKTREFTVNIPPAEKFKETDYCGLVSGRDRDKSGDVGLTLTDSKKITTAIIEECPYNIECQVVREVSFGEWVAVFGEILETHIDDDKIDVSTKGIDISKVNPLVYCATIREYWRLGEKIGKGFSAGKEILKGL
ncbi:MAG: flavin reductase family protein [Planctomycetota bacterium]|jgi:flavin reductase (DIM6/NTAB) family NADH-FMN oxidoreductase RutF